MITTFSKNRLGISVALSRLFSELFLDFSVFIDCSYGKGTLGSDCEDVKADSNFPVCTFLRFLFASSQSNVALTTHQLFPNS